MKKRIFSFLLVVVLCGMLCIPAAAAENSYLIDEADLLSDSEEKELEERIETLSETYEADFVIITVSALDGSIDDAAEEIYDALDYGQGDQKSGVLLLVNMDPSDRGFRIMTNGECDDKIGTDGIDSITEEIKPSLKDEAYAEAFHAFLDSCESYMEFSFGMTLIICLVIAFVIALIVTGVMRGQLKSVKKQDTANVYTKAGSMQVTHSTDLFLYRNVTRVKKAQNNSGSARSTGSSRSVGGSSF